MATQSIVQQQQTNTPLAQAQANVRQLTPAVDIYENEREYLVMADLPGVSPEALHVQYEPPELVIQGDRPANGVPAIRYARAFQLDSSIDPEGISAELVGGVLRVRLPKKAAARPRKIAVRSGA